MKNQNSLLTHAAVFVAGIGLAIMGYRAHSSMTAPDSDGRTSRSSSSGHASVGLSTTEARNAALRDRRESADRSNHSGKSVKERMEAIVQMADPLDRQLALVKLLERLGPDEFAAVAEQYRLMDHYDSSRGELSLILRGWAKADPLAALEYATQQLKSDRASATVLAAWAGRDPAAAESWALSHHTGDGANPYLAAVIRGIAPYDVAHATQLALSLPAGDERGDAMEAITRALFMRGADQAMAYPSTIQDPTLRAGLVAAISRQLVNKDPAQAGSWLASMKDPADQNQAARRIAEALASQDPQAAADWMRKLQPDARAEAARGIIPKMSAGDITGTAQWVNTLSGIPNYDKVVEEFVWSCDYRAPEQSAAWIRGVANQEQQTRLYHQMLGEWAKRDAAAVRNWVANNQVPESVTRRFIR